MAYRRLIPILLMGATSASAVTLTIDWLGGSGTWSTTTNWSTSGLPTSSDVVRIDPLDSLNLTVSVDVAAATGSLTIGSGDIVSLNNNTSLTISPAGGSASLTLNSGSELQLNSAGNSTSLLIGDGTVTASGSGKIVLGNNTANRITGTSASNVLINQTTIQGAGAIGANSLVLQNEGTITALHAAALSIDPSAAADSTNSGILEAASGGLLQIINGTIDNTGGTIQAADNGEVRLSGIEIKGGNLKTSGTGTFNITGSSTFSNDVTLDTGTRLHVQNATNLNVSDTLTIDGTLFLDSAGNATDLILTSATTTFDGAGKISLSNSSANRIYGSPGSNTLVNKITIEGAGQIGANSTTVDNQGTITALYGSPLTLDPLASFTNTGTIQAATGGLLKLGAGSFLNAGGQISAATGGEIELLSNTTITGGTLTSTGTGFFESRNSATLDGVSLTSGTRFNLPNATNLTLANAINNAGTLSLQSAGNATDLIIGAANTTLSGGGVIELSNNSANRIYGSASTHLLTNTDNTIRGSGQIGANSLAFTNQGIVEANLSSATLTLDPSATAFTNTGTYRAVNGGVLVLSTGSFNNTSGTIQAQTGSTVRLTGNTAVSHGTLDVGPGATLELSSGSFDSGSLTTATGSTIESKSGSNTLGGTFNLNPGASLSVENASSLSLQTGGSYTIDGTVSLESAGNSTDLIIFGGDVTLSGSGKILLDNNSANRIYGSSNSNVLTLDGLNLEGGGQLGANSLGISNNATIMANDATALTIDPSAAGVTNTGTLKADGGTLALTGGTYTNTGGAIESTAGSTVQFDGSTFTGGTLKGPGTLVTVGSNTFNDISLASGSTLTIANATNGTFSGTLQNAGTLKLNSAGNTTDAIAASGGLTLTGGGSVQMIGANSRFYAISSADTLTNTNNTIHGYGQLGANSFQLNNQSNIAADVNGQSLVVDANTTITNTGLFKAANGGTLYLQNSVFNNQTGGSIQSDTGSQVFFSGMTLNDGHLTGPGIFRNVVSSTFTNLDIDSGTTLDIDNATSATLSGTLNNRGQIHLNSAGNITSIIAGSSGLTLSGGGEIHLYGNINNRISGQTSATTITNVDNTIRGYGQLGANGVNIVNQGTISADTPGNSLSIDTATGLTNSGRIEVVNGGNLLLNGSTITNQPGGSFHSETGSFLRFASVTLTNGVLTGGGSIRNSLSSTYHDLDINSGSTLDIDNNTSATLSGTLNNSGRIDLNSVGNFTDLIAASSGLSLSGTGSIHLTGNLNNRLYGQTAATTLTNSSGHTIRGAGQLGANQLLLENQGTIEADGSGTLTIDLSSTFTNQGNLKATGSGGISLSDPLVNQGDVIIAAGSTLTVPGSSFTQSTGLTEINGGTLTASSLQIDGGDFDGHGSVNGPATFTNATITAEPGGLSFNSSLTLSSTTTVQIELAGTSSSTGYGNLSADSLFIDGMLQVRFGLGFENSILNTDTFTLLSAASAQSGTFSNAPSGTRFWTADGLGSFDVTYNALSVSLSNFQPVPEPSTALLLIIGIAIVSTRRPRRR